VSSILLKFLASGFQHDILSGPVGLTAIHLTPSSPVPTITDTLFSQNQITQNALGVFFPPLPGIQGQVDFGAPDQSRLTSPLVPLQLADSHTLASRYWSVSTTIAVGMQTLCSDTAAIVDTGTTLVLLASNFYASYQNLLTSLTGAQLVNNMLAVPLSAVNSVPPLNISIDGRSFDLVPEATLFSVGDTLALQGPANTRYSIVGNNQQLSGTGGLDVILGRKWMERYYTYYDTGSGRVSVASTIYTSLPSSAAIIAVAALDNSSMVSTSGANAVDPTPNSAWANHIQPLEWVPTVTAILFLWLSAHGNFKYTHF